MPGIDLKLDPITWDLVIENNDIATVDGIDAIKQNLRQRLQCFRGEYRWNLTRGVPYHDEFFKKNPNPIVMDTILKNVILNTEGIIELTKFVLDFNSSSRILDIDFKCITIEGELDYSGEIPL